jgi:L-ascorbate metabolism protein UlaG (beta-lactamase superfamily)
VLTDPVFCERASPVQWLGPRRMSAPGLELAALPPLDLVLVSHNHYDHLDKAAVRRISAANPDATWIAPLRLATTLRRWGARRTIELDWWESAEVGGMQITATPARHFSSRGFHDRNRTLWCGYALSIGGWRGYFAGDTAYHHEFAEVGVRSGPFDFVMLPIGAYEPRWFMRAYHVDPDEAVQVYQDVTAAHPHARHPLMLAIHWGTFRLTTEPVDEPPRRAIERWGAVGLDPALLWIARVGESRSVYRP